MNYREMTHHNCKTVLQPCLTQHKTQLMESHEGYLSGRVQPIDVWTMLHKIGEATTGDLASKLFCESWPIVAILKQMKRDGCATSRSGRDPARPDKVLLFYTATDKRPEPRPTYLVEAFLSKNPNQRPKAIALECGLHVNKVYDALKQLSDIVITHGKRPDTTYSLKGTA